MKNLAETQKKELQREHSLETISNNCATINLHTVKKRVKSFD